MYMYTCIRVCVCLLMYAYTHIEICMQIGFHLQGGEDSLDPLSCKSFSTKGPLNIGLFFAENDI